MTKQYLISLLVDSDVESFFDRDDPADYLAYVFRTGIKGYQDYEYEELLNECIDRNLEEVTND